MLHSFPLQDPEDQRIYNLLMQDKHLSLLEMNRKYSENFHYQMDRLKKANASAMKLLLLLFMDDLKQWAALGIAA